MRIGSLKVSANLFWSLSSSCTYEREAEDSGFAHQTTTNAFPCMYNCHQSACCQVAEISARDPYEAENSNLCADQRPSPARDEASADCFGAYWCVGPGGEHRQSTQALLTNCSTFHVLNKILKRDIGRGSNHPHPILCHVTARASKVAKFLVSWTAFFALPLFSQVHFQESYDSNPEGGGHEIISSPHEGCIAESMNLSLQTPSSLLRRL